MSKLARDHRNGDLARIHIAKQQLQMSDEDYRAMLWTHGRVHSSKDLDHAGRQRVLDYLKRIGFQPAPAKASKRSARPTPAAECVKLVRRVRAQLIDLGRLPDKYADAIAQQMFGVQFYEWCKPDQLHAITAALAVQQRKKGATQQ